MNPRSTQLFGAAVCALGAALCDAPALAQTPQEHAHHMAHAVMPFDRSGTVHVFKGTSAC